MSVKVPRGCIEDVLVQVDKFYYPVDFVVLDIHGPMSGNSTPIILGRPFLATCNALINCRSGQLTITFGNMTLEHNIFSACKLPPQEDDVEEVNFLDVLEEEHFNEEYNHALKFLDSFCEEIDTFPSSFFRNPRRRM